MIALWLAVAPAICSAMVSEFLMGTARLGHMCRTTAADFQTDRAFGTSLVATMISVFCFTASTIAKRRVSDRWR